MSREYGYDPVARGFHWLTALLIATAALLGITMHRMGAGSEAEVAATIRLYSIHKTIGVAAFFVALGRIVWALTHRRPGHLHPDRRIETLVADTTHWGLYGAMLVMPLSGWFYHATAPAFAPILWPFGQGAPFLGPDERLANIFAFIHYYSAWALGAAVALHVAGAFKHALVDMDATLARMTAGIGPEVPPARLRALPVLLAVAGWGLVIAYGAVKAPEPEPDPFDEIEEMEEM